MCSGILWGHVGLDRLWSIGVPKLLAPCLGHRRISYGNDRATTYLSERQSSALLNVSDGLGDVVQISMPGNSYTTLDRPHQVHIYRATMLFILIRSDRSFPKALNLYTSNHVDSLKMHLVQDSEVGSAKGLG